MIKFIKSWFQNTLSSEEGSDAITQTPINVVWIHGANQTSLSFQYLRSVTNFESELLLNYDSSIKFSDNLKTLAETINENQGPHFIIGHSLGGLYALHLAEEIDIVGAVSISTPFAGSWTADWAKFFVPSYQLFKDVGRRATPIKNAKKIPINIPWTQIVSTKGDVPYHGGPNDGVCTIDSMKARTDMEILEVPHSHFEVMCSDLVASILSSCYEATLFENGK
jgi:pimeloyl-ACP methyl ester carboxylesterase